MASTAHLRSNNLQAGGHRFDPGGSTRRLAWQSGCSERRCGRRYGLGTKSRPGVGAEPWRVTGEVAAAGRELPSGGVLPPLGPARPLRGIGQAAKPRPP
jgi:hypothetical protein